MALDPLKRAFLSVFPVIGPHADIEAELLLAGKKPVASFVVDDFDDEQLSNLSQRSLKKHLDRLRLDDAVEFGKLISKDVKVNAPRPDLQDQILRYYALPHEKDNLEKITRSHESILSGQEDGAPNADFGKIYGYRKRDTLLFNLIITNRHIPQATKMAIISMNANCQIALREQLLLDAGHDPEEWYESLPQNPSPAP